MTLRDDVWDAVIKKMHRTDEFKISDLPFDESQRHTARRVLREMKEMGWVDRENSRAAIWYPGEAARLYLDID